MWDLLPTFAQQFRVIHAEPGHTLGTFLHSIPWFAWVGIVAIICGSITSIVNAQIRHRERMEMIRMGMHPDAPNMPAKFPQSEV